jgi:hypothetical protein
MKGLKNSFSYSKKESFTGLGIPLAKKIPLIGKKRKVFFVYKEIQKGSGAKSYMVKSFLK